jgi:hypothetical protein
MQPSKRSARRLWYLVVLHAAVAVTPLTAGAQQLAGSAPGSTPLLEALRDHRQTLALEDGRLTGAGAELLLSEGRAAQFFLLGEEHGVAEVPALAAALFRELTGDGYRHLAIETGDGLAAALDSVARQADPLAALASFYNAHWPGAPFYTLREEAALLVEVVTASPAPQVLWGLDYDIMADRHALPRLRTLARTRAQTDATDRALAVADSLIRLAMEERNPGHLMMFGGPAAVLGELRDAWATGAGYEVGEAGAASTDEASRIIALLDATRRINGLWMSGDGLRSNQERARWNKRQFARLWEAERWREGEAPRVMLKFGASHMLRGRSFTDVHDLGAQASELADGLGRHSFHVLVVGGPGSRHAVMDPTVMQYRPAPSGFQAEAWARPLFDAADPARWTVYDLRPLRTLASQRRLGPLGGQLEKVIWGFDAVVVLTGSGPSTGLPIQRPW